MTHEDAGWNEVERRMSAPWVKVAGPVFVGALSGPTLFFDSAWAGPAWAQCLGPVLAGLLEGLLFLDDRLLSAPARPQRSRPLRLNVFAAFLGAAVAVSFLEQQLANLSPSFPFAVRAAVMAGLAAGIASLVGHLVFAGESALVGRERK